MSSLRLIFSDQLSESISSLVGLEPKNDLILMCEVWDEATYVKHHKLKIAFIFSAMRHFAEELQQHGYNVQYIKLDDPVNTGSYRGEVERVLNNKKMDQIIVTHPGEYRVLSEVQQWESLFRIPVRIRSDDRFLCSIEEFSNWIRDKKQPRMEYFYREMRKKHSILMNNHKPVGKQWNFDAENRKPPRNGLTVPKPYTKRIDGISKDVINLVKKKFSDHFGDLDFFYFAVTREQALKALDLFIDQRLINFGDYQDAMIENEPWMYHSHISFYLNCGLLQPLECVKSVEKAYSQGTIPLNAAEGFIRQIIGWREYIRAIYWLKMPEYYESNFFGSKRNLPNFYWTANTKMNCLHQCISETKRNAYAHHIQRLMVLGNFALLADIHPKHVNE